MDELAYPLSILVKAVDYRNLSSASLHVGLSQPQLSRLVARLEEELDIVLLDRQVKRNSSWTPQARRLAEVFQEHQRRLDRSLRSLLADQRVKQVHIGTLEGLTHLAIKHCEMLFEEADLETIKIDVFDRDDLEGKFLSGDLDIIFNTRVPSQSKPRYVKVCGFQLLEFVDTNPKYRLFSNFEYNQKAAKTDPRKTLVSNSLSVRRIWLEEHGGKGSMPTEMLARPRKGTDEILLIGGNWLDPHIWQVLNTGIPEYRLTGIPESRNN